jgi:hypothetical protein
MDPIVIIIGVVIVIALYFLYRYLSNNTLVSDVRSLKTAKINEATDLTNPGSKKFSYQFWLFVVSAPSSDGLILARSTDFIIQLKGTELYINTQYDKSDGSTDNKKIVITDKMPIQKWTYIAVNVYDSSNIVEMYVNGKLVSTVSMKDHPVKVTKSYPLTIGGGAMDAYITQLVRLPDVVSSDTVWSNYLSGNGQANLSNYLANYDFAMSISKDDVLQRRYQLFS